MSVIDCAVYRHGKRVDTPHDAGSLAHVIDDLAADDDPQSFLWAGLHDPTKKELSEFAGPLGLHDLAVEDAIEAHQRPKVEQYEKAGHLFMSVRAVEYHDDDIQTNEINMFLGEQFFLTVRKGGGHDLRSVRRHAEAHAEKLENGPIAALYAVLDSIVDDYEQVAAELEIDVAEVEVSVFSGVRSSESTRIYRLKRETL
ncbi:MAG TPA: CorA family divalent cation transporter, partial [Aeromicrobium sp.]|nr:CorA family divalent cation transporter [Aeromicrobium sp.]